MSDKGSKSVQNKGVNAILKWSIVVLIALILEIVAVFLSVRVVELRGKFDTSKLQNIYNRLTAQQTQISVLEKLPSVISSINGQSDTNTKNIEILIENFNQLNEEVKNNKMSEIIEQLNHRIEIIEENSRNETLILNLALMIKENILYQHPFNNEVELLEEMSKDNTKIRNAINVLNRYKNHLIKNNIQLAQQYSDLEKSFNFVSNETVKTDIKTENVMTESIKMLKGTVAKLNFDKVVLLKKDKFTENQQALINKLNNLVENYNYQEILKILSEHKELKNADEKGLENWKKDISDKINVEKALSEIITMQLSALRQDTKNKTIKMSKAIGENNLYDQSQLPINEDEQKKNVEKQFQGEDLSND